MVGKKFKQDMELEEFLDKYQVELPILKETTKEILDKEFSTVLAKAVKGEQFQTLSGTGQGDPPSAPRYDVGSDPILRALKKVTQEFVYKFNTRFINR